MEGAKQKCYKNCMLFTNEIGSPVQPLWLDHPCIYVLPIIPMSQLLSPRLFFSLSDTMPSLLGSVGVWHDNCTRIILSKGRQTLKHTVWFHCNTVQKWAKQICDRSQNSEYLREAMTSRQHEDSRARAMFWVLIWVPVNMCVHLVKVHSAVYLRPVQFLCV